MGAQVRTATEADVHKVLAFFAELQAERLPTLFRYESLPTIEEELAFLRRFADHSADLFVVELDDHIIGNLAISTYKRPQTAHGASLAMSILKPFRGRGLGSQLLRTAIQWCKNRSLRRVELEVLSNNPRARMLYERHGFVVEGRRRGAVAVDDEFVDAILMALQIEPAA